MKHSIGSTVILALVLIAPALAEEPELAAILGFDVKAEDGETPAGWGGGPAETIFFDSTLVHSGSGAARIQRDGTSPASFTAITKKLAIDFGGEWIELRGFLRTEGVSGFAGLWLREDSPGARAIEFDNMQNQGLQGTTDWTEYTIRLPVNEKARTLVFGVLLAGQGTVWADDLQLLVDGKPIAEAPKREFEPTILEKDQEFAAGSGITVTALTASQTENVAVLAMVWGFLKYHHPAVASGEVHWDFELFRVLPEVLAAPDGAARNRVLSQWVATLGMPESCDPCAKPPQDVHLAPRLDWIGDTELLDPTLSGQLQQVHTHRFSGGEQFYVSLAPNVGNPQFQNELSYQEQTLPDPGFRILAVLRLFNIIEYWFPYRNQLDHDWQSVLREFLPRLVAVQDRDGYRLELMALSARIRDAHANLWSELDVLPPRGECYWPVRLRFIQGRATVTALTDSGQGPVSGLEVGDVIKAVDGQYVDSLIAAWSPYYCASNQATRLTSMALFLPRGECGPSQLTIARQGKILELDVARLPVDKRSPVSLDRPGETFQLLSEEVAYLKLSSIRAQDIDGYLERAVKTRGLVIDIRNYPSEFVVFALGQHLISETTPFVRFTVGDLANPGAFCWGETVSLEPATRAYRGKVVILVNEVSFSQAEYTAMAFRTGPQAVVVGSTTAGADGNVSRVPLPGGLTTMISGIGVFYPDKTPTQRLGIIPDVVVEPSIEGIRQGRDEVLEEALRQILGPDGDEEMIRNTCQRAPATSAAP